VTDRTGPVKRYLAALRSRDWGALRATLHDDVVRYGPYRDVVRGGDRYAQFLRDVVSSLPGYELTITRLLPTGDGAVVELSETVDDPGAARLRTDEAVVFDVDGGGRITRVAVYLQRSHAVEHDRSGG
jgi:ketosteroid isomerase-like protein